MTDVSARVGRGLSCVPPLNNDMAKVFDEDAPFGLGTRAVHAGQRPDPTTGAIMTPLYQTSTYAQEGIGREQGLRIRPWKKSDT